MQKPFRFGRSARRWTVIAVIVSFATLALAATAFAASAGVLTTAQGSPKQARLQQEMHAQATANAASWHAPKHPAPAHASCPMSIQSNINVDVLPGDLDHITNVAVVAPTTGQPFVYRIYAGSSATNAEQGVLIVIRSAADPCAPGAPSMTFTHVAPSSLHGAVTLTAISGDTVAFTTTGGNTGHFNFISGQFTA